MLRCTKSGGRSIFRVPGGGNSRIMRWLLFRESDLLSPPPLSPQALVSSTVPPASRIISRQTKPAFPNAQGACRKRIPGPELGRWLPRQGLVVTTVSPAPRFQLDGTARPAQPGGIRHGRDSIRDCGVDGRDGGCIRLVCLILLPSAQPIATKNYNNDFLQKTSLQTVVCGFCHHEGMLRAVPQFHRPVNGPTAARAPASPTTRLHRSLTACKETSWLAREM